MATTPALTDSQLRELKGLLTARRRELGGQMQDNLADLAPPENQAGTASQDENLPLANQTREVRAQLTAMDEQELARIERALAAIDAGDYGVCAECGCPIPFERLKAEPMTQHCVPCKARLEARAAGAQSEPRTPRVV